MFLLALPATVGLIILARPIVSLLFERGEFSAAVAQMTAWALVWYAAGLVGHSIMEVLTRAFYAQQDTKTPVIIGAIAMGLNVLFSILFSQWFAQIGWLPLGGLALANSLATALEATALFIFMHRRLNGIEGKFLANGFVRCAVASFGMGLGLWWWTQAAGGMNRWVVALGGVALGGIIYLVGVLILKVPEIRMLIGMVTRRLRRSPTS
jgi:putative peptidoglycan lipid II flippase